MWLILKRFKPIFPLEVFRDVAQILDIRPREIMERRPFTMKERLSLKSIVEALPFFVGYLVILFIIRRETGGLTTAVLMAASFFAFIILYM